MGIGNSSIGPYLDISDDRVFKNVFGRPAHKDLLIALLNLVIEEINIVDLDYINNEFQGFTSTSKQSRMDLRVKTDKGTEIIVEVQVREQKDFADRALYYAALPILEEKEKGDDYRLTERIVVSFLHFSLPHEDDDHWKTECRSVYSLREKVTGEKLTNALNLIFVELGRFKKSITALDNDLERFYFCIKHMWKLQGLPEEMQDSSLMHRLFKVTALESLPKKEKTDYIKYMTTERDIRNQLAFAREQGVIAGMEKGREEGISVGRKQGREEERLATARNFKNLGVPVATIAEATGLAPEQIESL